MELVVLGTDHRASSGGTESPFAEGTLKKCLMTFFEVVKICTSVLGAAEEDQKKASQVCGGMWELSPVKWGAWHLWE